MKTRSEASGGSVAVSAPVRVDLSAGFGDVEPFCLYAAGYVSNVALELTVNVTISVGTFGGGHSPDLPHRLADRLTAELGVPERFRVTATAPGLAPGSGLGSSGALSVAVTYALLSWCGMNPHPAEAVTLAVGAERASGIIGGTQDQWASVCGGAGLVRRFQDVGTRTMMTPHPVLLDDFLAVVHPGGRRDSGALIRGVLNGKDRTASRRVVDEIGRLARELHEALEAGDLASVAALMNRSRQLLCLLDDGIVAQSVAGPILAAPGTMGAKPCGAGGPNAAWAVIVAPPRRAEFETAMSNAGYTVLRSSTSATGVRVTS